MVGFDAIALSLVKTLTSFIFGQILNSSDISIDGAPSWYMKETRQEICSSSYEYGNMASIDITQEKSLKTLKKRVEDILVIVVNENIKNATDDEREFLETFLKDKDYEIFILKNANFKNIDYNKKHNIAFARVCIERDKLLKFEKTKVDELKKTLSIKRSKGAFEELENEN
ncbi:hypothetical protein LF845_11515 [Deferribacterales bacterium Es71-Z0220]|jgi:hypothetical protein|uniref:hypothetical protein n=1 Tax=Deferrivibrio essentukiensis TaxID=2880922 RepID=UPI001F615269|nr:hypothetical protein [Deferrivibrio essentukiensis]MBZ4647070.1 hypothetical protein [Clostridia bacterium]MCB4205570.1 hypothetical protein [Deferrivibrio essentukiensis]